MVDNRASKLVRNLTASGQPDSITQRTLRRCTCNCPLVATINFGGQRTCSYHSGQDYRYWKEITMSINDNMELIKKLHKMTRWTTKDWTEQYHLLSQFYLCPMSERDYQQPTIYLNRFGKALKEKILNDASKQGDQHE